MALSTIACTRALRLNVGSFHRVAWRGPLASASVCARLIPAAHPRSFSVYTVLRNTSPSFRPPTLRPEKDDAQEKAAAPIVRENIYTVPNLLTLSRIVACPVLGWAIVHDEFYLATGLLVYAGLTDLVRVSPSFMLK
ncbi:hypothetical protein TRAPUB_12082 [Trametes pubescens]|uniref:Cardiolipin synthase (CMP-forming) n=1 Tax=Trametes pubescens TaxID=154538 RepID=A0A1M2VUV2_TRAPU|nr:hypothetical protein TRAPUB_12082 [Trametes pubescens]